MNETLQVGPFLLNFGMRYRLKAAGYLDKRIIETIENSLICGLR